MCTFERRVEVVDDRRELQDDVVRRDGYSIRRVEPHHSRTHVWAERQRIMGCRQGGPRARTAPRIGAMRSRPRPRDGAAGLEHGWSLAFPQLNWDTARSPRTVEPGASGIDAFASARPRWRCHFDRTVDLARESNPPGRYRPGSQRSRPCGHAKVGAQHAVAAPSLSHPPPPPSDQHARTLL